MRYVFRTDSSFEIGTGHVMRCLALADALRARNVEDILFVMRDLPGHIGQEILARGYALHFLPAPTGSTFAGTMPYDSFLRVSWQLDAEQCMRVLRHRGGQTDTLIVDHYALDSRWELLLKPHISELLVLDDLANRPHDCTWLHDHNFFSDPKRRYVDLVPAHTELLLGPRYALLRPEFVRPRHAPIVRTGLIPRIFVFMGGTDQYNVTGMVVEALSQLDVSVTADVVLGATNPHAAAVVSQTVGLPWVRIHHQVQDMAALMAETDLAIGGGGVTTWERCILGLPSLTVIMADNQAKTTEALHDAGAILSLGRREELRPEQVRTVVQQFLKHPDQARCMGDKAFAIMGGDDFRGAASVADRLLPLSHLSTTALSDPRLSDQGEPS